LATAAYPRSGGRKNTVRLIREFSGWNDAERVSRLQLRLALRASGLAAGSLCKEVGRRLRQQPTRGHTPLSASPLIHELQLYATTREELRILDLCTYSHLFYTYRSNLVHEFRLPSYQTDWGHGSIEPYYGESAFKNCQLVFPVAFVARIAHDCLQNLETYLLDNKIAPHSKFEFGSLWRWQ
jgi:hypothetical protein